MPIRSLLALTVGLALLAMPHGAAAAGGSLAPVERTLTVKRAADTDCGTYRNRSRRGVATTRWTAPMAGFVTVRLSARRGDWDLALVDAATRRPLATSAGFGAREVTQAWVSSGQRLAVRGCRIRGGSSRAHVSIRFFDLEPPRPATPSLIRVRYPSPEVLQWFDMKGFDVTHNVRAAYADIVVPNASKLALLRRSGIPFRTRIADLNRHYMRSRSADAAFTAAVEESPLPTGRTSYRKFADYQAELKQLADPEGPYADIVRPIVIGRSFQGREIQGVEIAENVRAEADGRPVYFLMAMHHAREWPSAEIAMEFAWMLAKGYGNNAEITDLLRRERVVIVPLVNPDGFFASRAAASDGMFPDPADTTGAPGGSTVEGVILPFGGNLAYRRKNCNGPVPSLGGAERDYPCYYQWGVDPNRNYGQGWGGRGASPDPNTQVYRGDGQWSEPETQAVHAYSQTHPVTSLITIHNVAALVLRPPGRRADGKAPDEARLKAIGDAMGAATGYTSQYGFELYDTSGTTEDWNYAAAGTFGYTIELGPVNGPFHGPYKLSVVDQWVGPAGKGGMREALLIAARSAANPADHSVISGNAPPGRVLRVKKTFDTKSSPVCTFAQGYVRAGTVPALDCIGEGNVRSHPDRLEYTTVVPPSGDFDWHVTPSTRPFVGGRYVEGEKVERVDTFEGAGVGQEPSVGQRVAFEFDVTEADIARELDLRLNWTSPEDYDLYLYFIDSKGERVPIGTGWLVDNLLFWTAPGRGVNYPGIPEHITLNNPPVGNYVAEVANEGGVLNDWTLTVKRSGQREGHSESTGVTEAWTLSCERPDGSVIAKREVTVGRGERSSIGNPCSKGRGGKR